MEKIMHEENKNGKKTGHTETVMQKTYQTINRL